MDGLHSFGTILRRQVGEVVIFRNFIVSTIEDDHADRVLRLVNDIILDKSIADISLPSAFMIDFCVVLNVLLFETSIISFNATEIS